MTLRDKIMNVDPALRVGVESTGGHCNEAQTYLSANGKVHGKM